MATTMQEYEVDIDENLKPTVGKDLFSDYLREIGRYPLLDKQQEIEYGTKVQEMMSFENVRRKLNLSLEELVKLRKLDPAEVERIYKEGMRCKQKLINHNLRLVVAIARRYSTINLSIYDMVQEGNIGLIKSVERFNPLKYDVKFSTYASWWIKESINKGITNGGRMIRLPVHVTDKIRLLRRAKKDFYVKHSRYPSVTELVNITGLDRDMILKVSPFVIQPVSLDSKLEPELSLIDYIADPTETGENPTLTQEHIERVIGEVLSILDNREKQALMYLYGICGAPKMDRKEYGETVGLSSQKVGQLERDALKKLRKEFGEIPEVKRVILSCIS